MIEKFHVCYVDKKGWSYFLHEYPDEAEAEAECAILNIEKTKFPWELEPSRKWIKDRYDVFKRGSAFDVRPVAGARYFYSICLVWRGDTRYCVPAYKTEDVVRSICEKENNKKSDTPEIETDSYHAYQGEYTKYGKLRRKDNGIGIYEKNIRRIYKK